jgi:hypothetical protein
MATDNYRRYFVAVAMLASFAAYFSVYAFRKPFAVATYDQAATLGAVSFKVALVLAQVLGYALSKFAGISLVSSLQAGQRGRSLLLLVATAWLMLVGFGLLKDHPLSLLLLFCNGLVLGMLWGIIFSYLEGRQTTELLSAALCASFIVSSGAVKSVGQWLMINHGVSDYWMPAVTGLLFLPPLLLSTYLLEKLPPPSAEDMASRSQRQSMDAASRRAHFFPVWPALLFSTLCYATITAFRDFRDNFAAELWEGLAYAPSASLFTLTEIPVMLLVLAVLLLVRKTQHHFKALMYYHLAIGLGCLLLSAATFALQLGLINGFVWMLLMGAGLYTAYVPMNAIFFDRMVAAFRFNATAGFFIYIVDAFGYLGSILVLLYKSFSPWQPDWLPFFIDFSYWASFVGVATIALAAFAFQRSYQLSLRVA